MLRAQHFRGSAAPAEARRSRRGAEAEERLPVLSDSGGCDESDDQGVSLKCVKEVT